MCSQIPRTTLLDSNSRSQLSISNLTAANTESRAQQVRGGNDQASEVTARRKRGHNSLLSEPFQNGVFAAGSALSAQPSQPSRAAPGGADELIRPPLFQNEQLFYATHSNDLSASKNAATSNQVVNAILKQTSQAQNGKRVLDSCYYPIIQKSQVSSHQEQHIHQQNVAASATTSGGSLQKAPQSNTQTLRLFELTGQQKPQQRIVSPHKNHHNAQSKQAAQSINSNLSNHSQQQQQLQQQNNNVFSQLMNREILSIARDINNVVNSVIRVKQVGSEHNQPVALSSAGGSVCERVQPEASTNRQHDVYRFGFSRQGIETASYLQALQDRQKKKKLLIQEASVGEASLAQSHASQKKAQPSATRLIDVSVSRAQKQAPGNELLISFSKLWQDNKQRYGVHAVNQQQYRQYQQFLQMQHHASSTTSGGGGGTVAQEQSMLQAFAPSHAKLTSCTPEELLQHQRVLKQIGQTQPQQIGSRGTSNTQQQALSPPRAAISLHSDDIARGTRNRAPVAGLDFQLHTQNQRKD